ncbi:MAG: GEVED domain-containing protein [Saprospiraceae bacterium]
MYIVRSDNTLFRSDNVNDTSPDWLDLSSSLPNSSSNIDDIKCDPTDPEIVFLIQSEKIYRSEDKGNTWTNITGTLPSGTNLNCLKLDKYGNESIYAGTKTGVYFKDASMSDWVAFDANLPIVDVREMDIYYGNTESRLRAGTYGRGLWESSLYDDGNTVLTANFRADKTIALVNATINLEDLSSSNPDNWVWSITPANYSFENGTGVNSQNPQISFTNTGTYTVSLTASNSNSSDTKTITSYIHIYEETPPPCTPATQHLGAYGMGILHVALNTIDNYSGQAYQDNPNYPEGYMNFINSYSTDLQTNTSYDLTVQLGSGYLEYWNVYIDYNNDGDFDDTGENVYTAPTKVSGIQVINFTTPISPNINELLRMRIICDLNAISGPCYDPTYGQAEDYGIIFINKPELSTNTVSNIDISTAQSGGNITNQGDSPITVRGIVWDIRENPTLDKNWGYTENGSGTGQFTSNLTNLSPNTQYYVRAYAINSYTIEYGQNEIFTTNSQEPIVTTTAITNENCNSITIGGNVLSDNGLQVNNRGLVWNTSPNPTYSINSGKLQIGTGIGSFSTELSNLMPQTTYYFRAYARNDYSISYGDDVVYTTPPPDLTQSNSIQFSDITTDQISLSWTNGISESRIVKINNINSFTLPVDGTDPVANSSYQGGEQVIYNGSGNSATVTNLESSTTYYFRIFDYNGSGASTEYNICVSTDNPNSASTYCIPSFTNSNVGTYIKGFSLNTIDNQNNGDSHYSNFTSMNTNLITDFSYDVGITMSYNPEYVSLWIDWNDNLEFESSEKLISDLYCAGNSNTSTQITIPANTNLGNHILRVRSSWGTGEDGCSDGNYGEAEDYTVIIKDEITWTGVTSTDWFVPTNWDVRKVPTIVDKVIINPSSNDAIIDTGLEGNARIITTNSGAILDIRGTLNIVE